jgi:hypothetical protein
MGMLTMQTGCETARLIVWYPSRLRGEDVAPGGVELFDGSASFGVGGVPVDRGDLG